MSEPLRLLHLEDNPADGELVRATLEEVWPGIAIERVDSEDAFIGVLERESVDLILADFSLPLYDGMSALGLSRRRFPHIPFIFVSGTLGEEKAIESMRCGATDYVLKNRLVRLVPAVERALKEKQEYVERRSAEKALRESEAGYRNLFDNMLEGFASCRMVHDEAGHPVDFIYLGVNRAFGELTGLRDVVGRNVSEVIPGIRETNPELLERYNRVAMTARPERFETFVPALGIWFSIAVYSRKVGEFIAVFDNITARKKAETAQCATIELLRLCNRAGNLREFMRDLALYFQHLSDCQAIGVRLRDGDDFPYFETRGFPQEFVLAENSLCARDQRGELARDNAGHPALDCMCGNVLCGRCDPAKPFFTPRGSFWSSCTTELLANTTEEDRQARTRNRCNGEGYESVALIPLRYQGTTYGLLQFNDKRPGRFTAEKIALLEDLVAYVAVALSKLKADEALRESNERFRMIFEHSIDAIMLTKTDGSILAANPEACRIFGMSEEEICGAGRAGLVDMDDARVAVLLEERKNTGRCRGEITMIRGDGSRFPAEISSAVFSGWGGEQQTSLVIRDVTGRKNLERQLLQSQKMEAVGTLAGGIAHDFNNIVTAMIGYCTLLQMEEKQSDKILQYVDCLMALSERAANLTRGLLAFSRHQIMVPRLINLNDIVATITTLISRLVGEQITMETHLSAASLTLMADYGQIEQILMNLATNAHDAMPDGGTLIISTDAIKLEPGNSLLTDSVTPGSYALLSVTDTGCGMDEATVARGFEPFFTTKEPGKGTGLGLSIIYGIVKQHHGFVKVASRPGFGTTFSIYLPLADAGEAVDQGKIVQPVRGGTETILVVEDEPAIRQVVSQILRQFGYRVLEAADGDEGTDLFRIHASEISLVILDTIMPRKHGKAVHEDIVRMKQETKTLFISGYPVDIIANKGLLPAGVVFLPKPVSPMDLLGTVRQLLDGQMPEGESPEKRNEYAL